jgi:hypothetical protein
MAGFEKLKCAALLSAIYRIYPKINPELIKELIFFQGFFGAVYGGYPNRFCKAHY